MFKLPFFISFGIRMVIHHCNDGACALLSSVVVVAYGGLGHRSGRGACRTEGCGDNILDRWDARVPLVMPPRSELADLVTHSRTVDLHVRVNGTPCVKRESVLDSDAMLTVGLPPKPVTDSPVPALVVEADSDEPASEEKTND